MRDRPNDNHRKIAQAAAGRPLAPNEVVDHKDEDKSNNALGNLRIDTRSRHTADHNRRRELSRLRSALRSFKEGRKAY